MANELKPCPFCNVEAKILRRSGTAGRVCPSKWYRERVECKVCGLTTSEYKKPGAAQHSWNNRHASLTNEGTTRPAAPVEGLERYTIVSPNVPYGDYVRFDQAEAIIAAKDEAWKTTYSGLYEEYEDLKTDNAALTARVKELEETVRDDVTFAKRLETQLAAARKALRNIAEDEGAPFRIKVHALATLEIIYDPH